MQSTYYTALLSLLALASATSDHHNKPKNTDVTVGADGKLLFNPEKVTAKVGDTVTFTFFPANHSVVQSDFANPCKPIKLPNEEAPIFSGFQPVPAGQVGEQKFVATIRDDTKPTWFYCAQTNGNHCQTSMTMVVNEPADPKFSLAEHKKLAALVKEPSQVPPAIAGGVFRPNDKPDQCDDKNKEHGKHGEKKEHEYKHGEKKEEGEGQWPKGGNAYMRARAAEA